MPCNSFTLLIRSSQYLFSISWRVKLLILPPVLIYVGNIPNPNLMPFIVF